MPTAGRKNIIANEVPPVFSSAQIMEAMSVMQKVEKAKMYAKEKELQSSKDIDDAPVKKARRKRWG